MIRVETAGIHPGDEPPAEVVSEILWRVAVRLLRDHQPAPAPGEASVTCTCCARPWPCSGVRMAELGLSAAKG
jgi:hypothetical protein